MMASLLSELRTKYNTLSKTQKIIADTILKEPEEAVLLSISDLAAVCDTSETTVMRLIRKLDYDSYQVFRINLAKDLTDDPRQTLTEDISESDTIAAVRDKIIAHNKTALDDLSRTLEEDALTRAVNAFENATRVTFYGVGASAAIAEDMMHKFGNIGMNVMYFPDSHMMNILCSHMKSDELFIGISHSGESVEVINAASIAKKHGACVIAMTSYAGSSLAKLADFSLLSPTNAKRYHSEAMSSRQLMLTIVDIVYTALFLKDEQRMYEELNTSRMAVSLNKT